MIDENKVEAQDRAKTTEPGATSSAGPSTSGSLALAGAEVPANLAMLLDAELEATIRFGDCELSLGDILRFAPGDVVELDQRVDEPAQLIVAGRTIARGEVVVVDGNFGLRITEVTSASQRAEVIRA
jgi:flagellar motor switch protein FliN/FliY